MTMMNRMTTILAAMFTLAPASGFAQDAPERTFHDVEWDVTIPVPGRMESDLLRPGLLIADDEAAYIYDYGDARLKAFDLETGALLWTAGRQGAGPGEFNNPTSIRLGDDGAIHVLDPPNLRVSRFSTAGELLGSVRVEERLFRLGAVHNGRMLGIRSEPSQGLLVELDAEGRVRRNVPRPAWADSVPAMAAGVWVTSCAESGDFAIVFPYSGRTLVGSIRTDRLVDGGAVETRPEPEQIVYSPRPRMTVRRLAPGARMLALSIAMSAHEVWVLINGEGEEGNRIVDRYDRTTGAYLGSWRLPVHLNRITAAGDRLVGTQTDMFPTLVVLERN